MPQLPPWRPAPLHVRSLRLALPAPCQHRAAHKRQHAVNPAPPALLQAYCLYRLGRLQDALAALGAVSADAEAARLQLEAQVQYRLGNCKEAIALYSQLFRAHGGEATADVRPNVLAAYVAGGRGSEVPAVMQAMKVGAGVGWAGCAGNAGVSGAVEACSAAQYRTRARISVPHPAPARKPALLRALACRTQISPRDSFELAFNAACALVEGGDLAGAQEQLQLAVRVGASRWRVQEGGRAKAGAAGAPPARWLLGRAAPRDAGGSRRAFLGVGRCRRGGAVRRGAG